MSEKICSLFMQKMSKNGGEYAELSICPDNALMHIWTPKAAGYASPSKCVGREYAELK